MMYKRLLFILCMCCTTMLSQIKEESNHTLTVSDGPHIFIEDDKLIEKQIQNGKLTIRELPLSAYKTHYEAEKSSYTTDENIVALSDIHGQFDLAIELLKNNAVIDDDLNWIYEKGHLIIVGDIFDRGNKVTETLWFVYNLEIQAKQKGGKVHFLLGNHEYMVIHKDLRYIHEKYVTVCKIMNTSYDELYSGDTILGRWLRSKATMVKINDLMFVHGGISKEFLKSGFDISAINQTMRLSLDREKQEMKQSGFYNKYYGKNGPIWYRGYFYGNLKSEDIDSILSQIEASHLVVGHCSQDHVVQLFDKRIFGVDSSIKNGENGEVLHIDTSAFYRGTLNGEKIKFN